MFIFVFEVENIAAFSSFPTMFSKGFLYSVVESLYCVVKRVSSVEKEQNFRLYQIQSICRRQGNSNSKIKIYVGKYIVGKGECAG